MVEEMKREEMMTDGNGDTCAAIEASEDRIAKVACELKEIGRSATLNVALRIGELIHREIFGGNVQAANVKKHPTFRALACHPDTPFSTTALWRATALYQMQLRIPHAFDFPNLGISHFRCVLGLSESTQLRLLTAAANGRWSKAALEQTVKAVREQKNPARAARRASRFVEGIQQRLSHWEERSTSGEQLSLDTRRVLRAVREIRSTCDRLEARFAAAERSLDSTLRCSVASCGVEPCDDASVETSIQN